MTDLSLSSNSFRFKNFLIENALFWASVISVNFLGIEVGLLLFKLTAASPWQPLIGFSTGVVLLGLVVTLVLSCLIVRKTWKWKQNTSNKIYRKIQQCIFLLFLVLTFFTGWMLSIKPAIDIQSKLLIQAVQSYQTLRSQDPQLVGFCNTEAQIIGQQEQQILGNPVTSPDVSIVLTKAWWLSHYALGCINGENLDKHLGGLEVLAKERLTQPSLFATNPMSWLGLVPRHNINVFVAQKVSVNQQEWCVAQNRPLQTCIKLPDTKVDLAEIEKAPLQKR